MTAEIDKLMQEILRQVKEERKENSDFRKQSAKEFSEFRKEYRDDREKDNKVSANHTTDIVLIKKDLYGNGKKGALKRIEDIEAKGAKNEMRLNVIAGVLTFIVVGIPAIKWVINNLQ